MQANKNKEVSNVAKKDKLEQAMKVHVKDKKPILELSVDFLNRDVVAADPFQSTQQHQTSAPPLDEANAERRH